MKHEDGAEEHIALQGEALSSVDVGHLPHTWDELREHASSSDFQFTNFNTGHRITNTLETTSAAQTSDENNIPFEDRIFDDQPEHDELDHDPSSQQAIDVSSSESSDTRLQRATSTLNRSSPHPVHSHHHFHSPHTHLNHSPAMNSPYRISPSPELPRRALFTGPYATLQGQSAMQRDLQELHHLARRIRDYRTAQVQYTATVSGGNTAIAPNEHSATELNEISATVGIGASAAESNGDNHDVNVENVARENYTTIGQVREILLGIESRQANRINAINRARTGARTNFPTRVFSSGRSTVFQSGATPSTVGTTIPNSSSRLSAGITQEAMPNTIETTARSFGPSYTPVEPEAMPSRVETMTPSFSSRFAAAANEELSRMRVETTTPDLDSRISTAIQQVTMRSRLNTAQTLYHAARETVLTSAARLRDLEVVRQPSATLPPSNISDHAQSVSTTHLTTSTNDANRSHLTPLNPNYIATPDVMRQRVTVEIGLDSFRRAGGRLLEAHREAERVTNEAQQRAEQTRAEHRLRQDIGIVNRRVLQSMESSNTTTWSMGTREDVERQGDDYVSPIGQLFSQAYRRYNDAEAQRNNAAAPPTSSRAVTVSEARSILLQDAQVLARPELADAIGSDADSSSSDDGTPRGLDAPNTSRPAESLTDEQMMRNMQCHICFQQLASVACMPCGEHPKTASRHLKISHADPVLGHCVMCKWCAERHLPSSAADRTRPIGRRECPLCRRQVRHKYDIFFGA